MERMPGYLSPFSWVSKLPFQRSVFYSTWFAYPLAMCNLTYPGRGKNRSTYLEGLNNIHWRILSTRCVLIFSVSISPSWPYNFVRTLVYSPSHQIEKCYGPFIYRKTLRSSMHGIRTCDSGYFEAAVYTPDVIPLDTEVNSGHGYVYYFNLYVRSWLRSVLTSCCRLANSTTALHLLLPLLFPRFPARPSSSFGVSESTETVNCVQLTYHWRGTQFPSLHRRGWLIDFPWRSYCLTNKTICAVRQHSIIMHCGLMLGPSSISSSVLSRLGDWITALRSYNYHFHSLDVVLYLCYDL